MRNSFLVCIHSTVVVTRPCVFNLSIEHFLSITYYAVCCCFFLKLYFLSIYLMPLCVVKQELSVLFTFCCSIVLKVMKLPSLVIHQMKFVLGSQCCPPFFCCCCDILPKMGIEALDHKKVTVYILYMEVFLGFRVLKYKVVYLAEIVHFYCCK